MHFKKLSDWLDWISSLHVTDMDLSLERVLDVATRLNLLNPTATVVTVGGTNGKGSCVATIEAIYMAAGYRVGAFTSPVLFHHNEYVRIQKIDASDEQFCEAFERIDAARGEITLTPFEFNALAAFDIFQHANLDVWILEVGLGGRFDAVNVLDADLAMVASIGIDHVEWLGDTREKIAFEKAGIFRKNKPAVCGDFDPPHTLIDYANHIAAPLFCQNREFGFERKESSWTWWSQTQRFEHLPISHLALQNMATVLMGVELLQAQLPVNRATLDIALASVNLPGRIEIVSGDVETIFDVSHNPAAAEFLASWLKENPTKGKTRAVFSMLGDKDIPNTLRVMKDFIDEWFVAALPVKRGASLEKIEQAFAEVKMNSISCSSVKEAHETAMNKSKKGDRVVVFGSFHTVAICAK